MLATVHAAVDAQSFATVFNTHYREAVRLAYLLVSDAGEAEDVVSEAFAKLYPRWRRGQVREVAPYLRRTVANTANSRLRRRYLERGEAQRRSGDHRGVRRVDDGAADRDEVWSAVRQLPARQRQAVVLRYFEDLSVEETAATMGCSVGSVKSTVSRGLDRLEELLATDAASGSKRTSDLVGSDACKAPRALGGEA